MFEEDEDIKSIITFVQQRVKMGNPVQYGEIHDHFGWGQSKWQSKWNAAKKYLESRSSQKGGYPRYYVKQDFSKDAEKTLASKDFLLRISKGDLNEVEVSSERAEKMAKEFAEEFANDRVWSRAKDTNFKNKMKTWEDKMIADWKGKPSKKDLKTIRLLAPLSAWAEAYEPKDEEAETISFLARYVKIRVISEKGESSPVLSDQDIKRLYTTLFFSCVDLNTRWTRKSLHIWISLEVPQDVHDAAKELARKDHQNRGTPE